MAQLLSPPHKHGLLGGTTEGAGWKMALLGGFFLAYLTAEATMWLMLVPNVMSVATFTWVTVAALLMTVIAGTTAANARATRSIAHVLYDVENPAVRRR